MSTSFQESALHQRERASLLNKLKNLLLQAALPTLLLVLATTPSSARAQGIVGNWRTSTGSVVQVYACSGAICLRVLAIEKTAPGTVDENNPDPRLRSRSLCGLQIGSGFQPKDGGQSAETGQIYDPKNGKTYSASLAIDGADHLKLRGYMGVKLFGRTEEWTRTAESIPACH